MSKLFFKLNRFLSQRHGFHLVDPSPWPLASSFFLRSFSSDSSSLNIGDGTSVPSEPKTVDGSEATTLALKKAKSAVRLATRLANQAKVVADVLGSCTHSSRTVEILDILLEKHLAYIQMLSPSPSVTPVLDFMTRPKGRLFLKAYLLDVYVQKRGAYRFTDIRLIKLAHSYLSLLPSLCIHLDTGLLPLEPLTATKVSSMAKAYATFVA